MRKPSLAWVVVAAVACGLTGLSACGGDDSAGDGFAGGGGALTLAGSANTGGDLAVGGSAVNGGTGGTAVSGAGTSAGGVMNGGAGKGGGTAIGGAAAAGAANGNGGAVDVAGASNAGASGVVDCGGACPAGRPVCDPDSAMCVECLADVDCKDPSKPGCLLATHRCEDCSKNSQCPPDKPMCNVQKGQCQ